MFKASAKMLKQEGKGWIYSHPPMEDDDLRRMAQYFKDNIRDNPTVLLEKVFVDTCSMVHFGRRGRENLRNSMPN